MAHAPSPPLVCHQLVAWQGGSLQGKVGGSLQIHLGSQNSLCEKALGVWWWLDVHLQWLPCDPVLQELMLSLEPGSAPLAAPLFLF